MERIELTSIGKLMVGSPTEGHQWVTLYADMEPEKSKKIFDDMTSAYDICLRAKHLRDKLSMFLMTKDGELGA